MPDTAARLTELGIELPDPPAALRAYVPPLVAGALLYSSGVLPLAHGELRCVGVVGADLGVEAAAAGARLCALNLLSLIRAATASPLAAPHEPPPEGDARSAPRVT